MLANIFTVLLVAASYAAADVSVESGAINEGAYNNRFQSLPAIPKFERRDHPSLSTDVAYMKSDDSLENWDCEEVIEFPADQWDCEVTDMSMIDLNEFECWEETDFSKFDCEEAEGVFECDEDDEPMTPGVPSLPGGSSTNDQNKPKDAPSSDKPADTGSSSTTETSPAASPSSTDGGITSASIAGLPRNSFQIAATALMVTAGLLLF